MAVYYSDNDPFCVDFLRNLIRRNLIADGEVDSRDLRDVKPEDLSGFTQHHFFAGIGGWSYALRLAGWPDDRPVWTGSCPCQPFSVAGKGKGKADERHLWPDWYKLIKECQPATIFGEQVASKAALGWWDSVQDDLESQDYACGAFDLCSAGIWKPHIRQRLVWVADRNSQSERSTNVTKRCQSSGWSGETCGLVNMLITGLEGHAGDGGDASRRSLKTGSASQAGRSGGLADRDSKRCHGEQILLQSGRQEQAYPETTGRGGLSSLGYECRSNEVDGLWGSVDWLFCRDGKWRPVEPGTFPLADGVSSRVGRLRAYGNSIDPQLCAAFIEAFNESLADLD